MHDRVTLPIHISCYDELVTFTKAYTEHQTEENAYFSFSSDDALEALLNSELEKYGLPKATRIIIVKRSNMETYDENSTHVDRFTQDPSITHKVSIIIPIENCDKAPMYWYDGNYTVELSKTKTGHTYPKIEWHDKPSFYHTEFITEPKICNIDMPHGADCPADGSYRTVLTFRLEGNPSFDEVCKKVLTTQKS